MCLSVFMYLYTFYFYFLAFSIMASVLLIPILYFTQPSRYLPSGNRQFLPIVKSLFLSLSLFSFFSHFYLFVLFLKFHI